MAIANFTPSFSCLPRKNDIKALVFMSESWQPVKFSSEDDTNIPETYSETEALIHEDFCPPNDLPADKDDLHNLSHTIPLFCVPEKEIMPLEADSGLYSKFKNTRVIEEYSIYDPKGSEEKYSFISNLNITNIDELSLTKEFDKERKISIGFTLSVLLTVFTMEFAGALEIVYITPYFLKVKLNEWIDATIWMVPLLFITLIKAPISILAAHRNYQRPTQFTLMWIFIIGCILFTYVDEFPIRPDIYAEDHRQVMTWIGLLAFCFIDVANEMISVVQNRVIEENVEVSEYLSGKISITGSFAKTFGYFCGSLHALDMSSSDILEINMDRWFLSAGGLMLICMLFSYVFQTRSVRGFQGSLIPKFKSLKLHHFLPSLKKVLTCSGKMKLIITSHFFGAASIVMLSVYATAWIAQDVLRGNPMAKSQSPAGHLFEEGVSWGALGLMLTSIVILFMGFCLHKMVGNPHKIKFKMLHVFSQLLSSLAIFACLLLGDLNSVLFVIPLTGFAFQTFHTVPELLAEIVETEEGTIAGRYRRLLDSSFFYAQVLMWLIVPFAFVFFPTRDDNQWGMLAAASSGLASVIFALFI